MKKNILFAVIALTSLNTLAHAGQFWIDPAKGDAPHCVDGDFPNQPYTTEGPSQHFVFTSPDGEKHSIFFENHEECLSKLHFVQNAWVSGGHQWVQVNTSGSEVSFGLVTAPVNADYAREIDHLSEKVWALQKEVDTMKHHPNFNRVISSEKKDQ